MVGGGGRWWKVVGGGGRWWEVVGGGGGRETWWEVLAEVGGVGGGGARWCEVVRVRPCVQLTGASIGPIRLLLKLRFGRRLDRTSWASAFTIEQHWSVSVGVGVRITSLAACTIADQGLLGW